ncbi:hypothetical protein B5807_11530 [Epicoccum nigrum]|uniref:Uncharacterized protein n=1 Tax=Epicoccum nigrum TaxID=105696 RepID=A0A1Y2LKE1_EPING|nr:hypothetical protein B5807_11530 [Epicoccum nigrum]
MVNWTPDKDRVILMGIFKFHDLKISKDLLEYLAKDIGGGCTPKAVSHRLSNLKNSGKMTAGGSSPAVSSPAVKKSVATPRTPRTPRTPASARARSSKKAREEDEEDETATEDGSADDTVPTPSVNRQRRASQPKRSYAESDAASDDEEDGFTPINKKVKKEAVDEEVSSAFAVPGASAAAEPEDVEFV